MKGWGARLAAGTLLLAATGAGLVSLQRTQGQLAVLEACEAAQSGDAERAFALTEGRTGANATGRAAAECRCLALLARGQAQACAELLDPLVAEGEDWVPRPDLAALVIRARRAEGRDAAAARLARAAGYAHPADPEIFRLELETRAAREDETSVLRELEARLPARGDDAARMRVSLAQRYLRRGDAPAALRVLGYAPPSADGGARPLWFDTLGIAHAMNDDLAGARATYERWARAGGDVREVRARYALALSISGLHDPTRSTLALLREALDDAEALADPKLEEALAIRVIFTLVNAGRLEEALAVYDRRRGRVPLEGIDRGQIERAWRERELAAAPPSARRGRLRFRTAEALPGATLWLSPDSDVPPDAPYERHPLAPGRAVEVSRRFGIAPQRWVLRDGAGRTRASGSVYPEPGATREVAIAPGPPPSAPAPRAELSRAPADGRRRVALVLLDCADWNLTGYLRARGELPALDALLSVGYRAVLESEPPLTAAALEALVWPGRRSAASLAGTFYQVGSELAGLESVGRNPFELLSWLLPSSRGLFETLGSGEHTAANLLLSHGGVRAGRHGVVTGPHGATRRLPLGHSERELTPAERERFPGLAAAVSDLDAHYVRTIAAEFDATDRILEAGEVDFLAVRIEPLDILTHAHFAAAAAEGQDDGRGLLFDVYRYNDARLAALHTYLDADDILIVMSDHGIRTAMEHSPDAIFVASGEGVPGGRAPGHPDLRGVPRVVADLLGVPTDWPHTGVADWESALAAREEPH